VKFRHIVKKHQNQMNSSFSHGYDITVDPMIARNN